MRTSEPGTLLIALSLLTSCGANEKLPQAESARAPKIACALDLATTFAEDCSLTQQGDILILAAPDGGFRRLRIVKGGVEAADGAEPASITPLKDMIEVRIGDDAYRLPARIQ